MDIRLKESLNLFMQETEQILEEIYLKNFSKCNSCMDLNKYERHITSLVNRTEDISFIHKMLAILIEKIHEKIAVLYNIK